MGFMPLLLDLGHRKVVIFGGGEVGLRRAHLFDEFSADTTLVTEGNKGKEGIKVVEKRVKTSEIESLIDGAHLVMAATDDPEFNDEIVDRCRKNGTLVGRVDEGERDFIVPAILRMGSVTVAVATGGKSPALARMLREKLEAQIGIEYALMADLQARFKQRRKEILGDQEVWELLRRSDLEGALALCGERYR
jgi:precorrin-2 dehydrogenase/sirohydrochlorin ferrochelatase